MRNREKNTVNKREKMQYKTDKKHKTKQKEKLTIEGGFRELMVPKSGIHTPERDRAALEEVKN